MKQTSWDVDHLPPQHGKRLLVTGASSGIGYFVAEQLASTGAEIILATRDTGKTELAQTSIGERIPGAQLQHLPLDLADLGSVRDAAEAVNELGPLDGAILNAGLLAQDSRRETPDGHELVYGTNHLGHFLLAALIYPALALGQGRLITMGSVAARRANLDLENLESTATPYRGFDTYKRSKLAQMVFAFELDRRLREAHSPVASIVAHPGGALDGLTPPRPPMFTPTAGTRLRALPLAPLVQGKDAAARPAVRALLDSAAAGGQLWGPRLARSKGHPALESPNAAMTDRSAARRLWELSELATATSWPSLTT